MLFRSHVDDPNDWLFFNSVDDLGADDIVTLRLQREESSFPSNGNQEAEVDVVLAALATESIADDRLPSSISRTTTPEFVAYRRFIARSSADDLRFIHRRPDNFMPTQYFNRPRDASAESFCQSHRKWDELNVESASDEDLFLPSVDAAFDEFLPLSDGAGFETRLSGRKERRVV